jgi:hypothetical protein
MTEPSHAYRRNNNHLDWYNRVRPTRKKSDCRPRILGNVILLAGDAKAAAETKAAETVAAVAAPEAENDGRIRPAACSEQTAWSKGTSERA